MDRIKKVRMIVQRYYEPGNNRYCYKSIWRRYVYPLYPISYRTFLSYLDIPVDDDRPSALEQSLFDFWDGKK